jgi:hypothetical protein
MHAAASAALAIVNFIIGSSMAPIPGAQYNTGSGAAV